MRVLLIGLSPSIGMQFYSAGLANALVGASEWTIFVAGTAALRKNAYDAQVRLETSWAFSGTGLSQSALNVRQFFRMVRWINELEPALVHLTGPHLWNLPLALYLRRRYPLLLSQHDARTHPGASGEQLKRIFRLATIQAVDRVVVHSDAVASALVSQSSIKPAISVMPLVHHNFDLDLYRSIRNQQDGTQTYENMALLFGRMEAYKGVREFLEAARLLCALDDKTVMMVVAGTGRLSYELDSYGDLPNLEIRNYLIDDDETIDLFGRAGLIVLPYSEGSQSALIPLAYLFRKPVLVTRVGALPEYVQDGVTGQIIDSNDPTIIASAIRELFADNRSLVEMGKAGNKLFIELDRQFQEQLLLTYKTVIQENQM